MMAKVDEIINDVVAPERQRALEETEGEYECWYKLEACLTEVTRSTLSAATLPSQVCEPQTKLSGSNSLDASAPDTCSSEEDNSALLRMAGELQRDELVGALSIPVRLMSPYVVLQEASSAAMALREAEISAMVSEVSHGAGVRQLTIIEICYRKVGQRSTGLTIGRQQL